MILPMITAAIMLGKTFRLDDMSPGRTIFEGTAIKENTVVTENPFTRTEYKMIESSSDVNDFLDLEGELSLFQKSGKIKIEGSGKYLFETVDRSKTVELLMSVNTQQKVETLPTYVQQISGWEKRRDIGTHYVRSIIYGGQLIITYQMQTDKAENMEEIKAVVKANLETSGSLNAEVEGKLEKISKELEGKCTVRIYAYVTGDIFQQPMDLEGAFKLIEEFPEKFEKFTKDTAYLPMYFELEPLSNLSPQFPQQLVKKSENEILDEAVDKYDDMRFAFENSKNWEPEDASDEMLLKINDFKRRLDDAKEAMENAIASVNMSKPLVVEAFEEAFQKYAQGGINIPNRYTRELNALRNAVKKFVPKWYPYTRAVNEYIHWGNIICSLPSPDPIVIGMAASSPRGFGSGSDLHCVETKPSLITQNLSPEMKTSAISGLSYQHPHKVPSGPLLCARCKLENATSILTVPGKKHCPADTKFEYDGYLATGTESVTDPICIDMNTVDRLPGLTVSNDPNANVISPMWIKCTNCEDNDDNMVHYVPCVVCSR